MSGDLSLSRALGGLRIANPDDATSSPARGPSIEPEDSFLPTPMGSNDHSDLSLPHPPPSPMSGVSDTVSPAASDDFYARSPGRSQQDGPSSPLKGARSSSVGHRQPRNSAGSASAHLQVQYSTYAPGAVSTSRPASGASPPSATLDGDLSSSPQNMLRNEPSRSSMYNMPSRSDSRSGLSSGYGSQASPLPSRETSYRAPSGAAPPPPRKSSKGMGGGYVTVPGVPMVSQPGGHGPEIPLPASSEEWKDRGAAVSVRKEVDANGKTVMRSVKKGVRDFSFGRVLGEGSYSTVYLATDRQTLKEYAIKVLEKKHIIKEKKIKYVNIEKNTLNRLTEHPGIVRLYYTFQDETSLYYVLDLCVGGELLGVLKKTGTFDVDCTRFYCAQILDAIDYMHSRGVIHRDLKPENVLLDDSMHIKITDFGTAKLLNDPRDPSADDMWERGPGSSTEGAAASFVGTAEYVSPELLTDKSASKASDMWAFGCIIYQLLAGRPPFKGGTEYLTFQKIVALEYEFPAGFPPAARDLVERCLVLNPALRLTVEHVKNHEFFDGQRFGKELWRTKAPRLRPYVPPVQEPHIIKLNGLSATPSTRTSSPRAPQGQWGQPRPAQIITELPPPTQLDIEWSPVLTRNNERILKCSDLMVISSPIPSSSHGKDGEGHKKLSRFFGGNTTKKRQRLVMVTSSGRIVLAPAGGEEKKAKQEISLLAPDCAWRTQVDAKGQNVWCVDTAGVHYVFEEPKSSGLSGPEVTVDDWIEALEQARDFALSQSMSGYGSENGFGAMSSLSMSSPASTLGSKGMFPDSYGDGFSVSDRSGRNQLTKSQASLLEDPAPDRKRNRFSMRQSKNGLGGAAF